MEVSGQPNKPVALPSGEESAEQWAGWRREESLAPAGDRKT